MIFDSTWDFSVEQAVTADAASTNVVDLSATGTVLGAPAALVRDIGKGRPIPIVVKLMADATGTSPTLGVTMQVDSVENFASPKDVGESVAIAGGSAGDEVTLYYVPEGSDERYIRLHYDVGGTSPEYSITAGVVLSRQTNTVPGA